jgi:hypothetical protein
VIEIYSLTSQVHHCKLCFYLFRYPHIIYLFAVMFNCNSSASTFPWRMQIFWANFWVLEGRETRKHCHEKVYSVTLYHLLRLIPFPSFSAQIHRDFGPRGEGHAGFIQEANDYEMV